MPGLNPGIHYLATTTWGCNRCTLFVKDEQQMIQVNIDGMRQTYETPSWAVSSIRMFRDRVYCLISHGGTCSIMEQPIGDGRFDCVHQGAVPDDWVVLGNDLVISIGNQVYDVPRNRNPKIRFECPPGMTIKFAAFCSEGSNTSVQLYYICFAGLSAIGPYQTNIYDDGGVLLAQKIYQFCPLSYRCHNFKDVTVWSCGQMTISKFQRQYHRYLSTEWQNKVAELRVILIAIPTEIFEIIICHLFTAEAISLSESQDTAMWQSITNKIRMTY